MDSCGSAPSILIPILFEEVEISAASEGHTIFGALPGYEVIGLPLTHLGDPGNDLLAGPAPLCFDELSGRHLGLGRDDRRFGRLPVEVLFFLYSCCKAPLPCRPCAGDTGRVTLRSPRQPVPSDFATLIWPLSLV